VDSSTDDPYFLYHELASSLLLGHYRYLDVARVGDVKRHHRSNGILDLLKDSSVDHHRNNGPRGVHNSGTESRWFVLRLLEPQRVRFQLLLDFVSLVSDFLLVGRSISS
jgi:hypothetical protein